MDAAKEAMARSKVIRREITEAIDHTHRMQVAAHAAVNEGLTRKLAQTVTLTVSIITCIALVLQPWLYILRIIHVVVAEYMYMSIFISIILDI